MLLKVPAFAQVLAYGLVLKVRNERVGSCIHPMENTSVPLSSLQIRGVETEAISFQMGFLFLE